MPPCLLRPGVGAGRYERVVLRMGSAREQVTARVWCPVCGQGGLIDEHPITADGLVTPAVACYAPGCGFQAVLRLEGWRP